MQIKGKNFVMGIFGNTASLRPIQYPKALPPKLLWYPIDTLRNILSYIGMSEALFAGEAGSKTEPLEFC